MKNTLEPTIENFRQNDAEYMRLHDARTGLGFPPLPWESTPETVEQYQMLSVGYLTALKARNEYLETELTEQLKLKKVKESGLPTLPSLPRLD